MNGGDSELVAQCLRGDENAMEALYRQHAPAVAVYFKRSGFATTSAEDLAQEVFSRAFRSLRTFDASRGTLRSWLAAIARNAARRHWQKNRISMNGFDSELATDVLSAEEDPRTQVQRQEEIAAVSDCVGKLPAPLADIVRLRYVDGRTTRGVADRLDMPEATVRLRLTEAKRLLENCLKGKGVIRD